ncbi:PAS domain-containing protein [Desulfosarcina cetonica]|uniref:PAS domain-containing protein n=1 Tax=Desulfosarcina cetonica TaxID=90730 RepID=UPI0006CF26AD|nr:PAS domain-containing protein [Desulfosarcina cetonica]
MTTTIDPTDDAIGVCPETGLPITSRPDWTRRPFGKGYWFTTRAIGDRILFNQPCGHAQLEGLVESLKMTEAVIRSCIDLSAGYVLISDYSGMRGISREARTHYVRYMDQQDQMLGVVYFGVSPWFRIMINLARRLLLVKRKVYIEKDYRSAITAAMGLLGGETAVLEGDARSRRQWDADISEVIENGHHVLRCPRWRLALDDYTLTIEVIDRRIYHGISTGTMRGHHVAPVSQLRERVRRMLGFESGFPVIITTMADGQRARRRVRHQFIDSLKKWHARYPLTAYIFYETNWFGRTAAMLASPLLPFRLRTVVDFETALSLADRFLGFAPLTEDPAVDVQPVPEVRQLLQFLGNIDWERQGMPIPAEIDAAHPFRPVFEAIASIKGGLDAVFEARDQAEKALRESQQRFEEVLKHSRDILFKRDIQSGAYDYVSNAMMTFLGLTRQEVDALDFNRLQALVHPDDLPAFLDYNDRLMSRVDVPPDASASRYRLRDKQGKYLWFTDKRAIVRDAQGRARAVLGSSVRSPSRSWPRRSDDRHMRVSPPFWTASPPIFSWPT